jgi:hypothetical protein
MIRFFGNSFFRVRVLNINLLSERSEDNNLLFYYNRVQNHDILILYFDATSILPINYENKI